MGVLRKKHNKKSRRPSFKSVLTSILATQAAIFLLLLAGVSLAGTAVAFIASMPLFVVFSPILVPAGVATGLLATGLAAAGSSGAMAVSLILWVFKYTNKIYDYGKFIFTNFKSYIGWETDGL